MSGPGARVHVAELLAHRDVQSLEAEAEAEPGAEKQQYSMHAFGAQFAEIRIDEDTGEMRALARWSARSTAAAS